MKFQLCLLLLLLGAAGQTARGERIEKTERLGPVVANLQLEPSEPLIGDPISLTLNVVAEKDVELLMPEFGEALDRFTILDFVPKRQLDNDGRTVASQRYRLQPPMSGKQSIPPILIEFVDRRAGEKPAPEGQDAYELLTPRIDFTVKSVVPTSATSQLKPPLGELQLAGQSRHYVWVWGIAASIALAGAVTAAVILRSARRRARRRSAYDIARDRLNRLTARPLPQTDQPEQIDRFFVELSNIVRHYLEDRFDLRAPELTTEEFLETVSAGSALSREHQMLLREFLRQADLVKFAGVHPSEQDIRRSLEAADRFLTDTRENAPLIEDYQTQTTHG